LNHTTELAGLSISAEINFECETIKGIGMANGNLEAKFASDDMAERNAFQSQFDWKKSGRGYSGMLLFQESFIN